MKTRLSPPPYFRLPAALCRPGSRSLSPVTMIAAALVLAAWFAGPDAVAEEPLGVRAPEGFEVTLFADDDLAHDVYSMTVDAQGRVVVSGAGYVRILLDKDGDGRAEAYRQFTDGPQTGAQGLFFEGRDLLCTGDAGLIRYRDADGDDRADGPPETVLRLKTGGEHHAHAVIRGPDGWLYVIIGNLGGVTSHHAQRTTSPVRQPQAGAVLRITPDSQETEVVCHGLRNAYDFDFGPRRDLFVYDSDGERDVTLPWYRPTRVFHMLPGSHAGWLSRSWKRPDDFADMPPVLAAFGRGSPTGVCCYRHRQFPQPFQDAVFAADWTFGRVMALPLERNGGTYRSEPVDFMAGVGQFGFAPTDLAVGSDGSLYVSIGGRGTRGGVFRVTWNGRGDDRHAADDDLMTCLSAPQPLASWSRARWMPAARRAGREPFAQAAQNESLPSGHRVRAIEILTEMFAGLSNDETLALAGSSRADVRAAAAWSHGRTHADVPDAAVLQRFLSDSDPRVVRAALEALCGAPHEADVDFLANELADSLVSSDRFVRQSAARVVARLTQEQYDSLAAKARTKGPQALVTLALAAVGEGARFDENALEIGVQLLEQKQPDELKLEAVRLVQLALGDLGSNGRRPAVFDGYSAQADLDPHRDVLAAAAERLAPVFPTGNSRLDEELARVLAMLAANDARVFERLLAQITDESHPVDDIHVLIVTARLPVKRGDAQRQKIASALLALEPKILGRGLNQDSNWDSRIGEMYTAHVQLAPTLPETLFADSAFGRPGHVYFLEGVGDELTSQAADAFVEAINRDVDYPWSPEVVYLLGQSDQPAHREMVREKFDEFALRDAVLLVLASRPDAVDRPRFVAGLDSSSLDVLSACVRALRELPASEGAGEQFALVRLVRRLGQDQAEYPLRQQAVELLRRNTGQEFGFVLGKAGYRPQPEPIAAWTNWLSEKHLAHAARELGGAEAEIQQLKDALAAVDWDAGDAGRGHKLFESRTCARCHGSSRALGPDLKGVARRFSRDDLFTSIVAPSRDVSPRYQTTLVQTAAGKVYTGLVVYESVDGLLLRNAAGQTFRIESHEIEFHRPVSTSLMPTGLLKDATPQDLADLYTYLASLGSDRISE